VITVRILGTAEKTPLGGMLSAYWEAEFEGIEGGVNTLEGKAKRARENAENDWKRFAKENGIPSRKWKWEHRSKTPEEVR
jgi:hypothetical protein